MHQIISDSPLLGDTTSNQALLFSSSYLPIEIPAPTYPNYTLPAANMSQPDQPTSSPNFTLKIFSTSAGFANKPHTACFLQSQVSEGSIANKTQWARDALGWRTQWLLGGLTPATNYTAFVLQSTNVSGPIFFATKSGAFVNSFFSSDLFGNTQRGHAHSAMVGVMNTQEALDISWSITCDYGLSAHHVDAAGISTD